MTVRLAAERRQATYLIDVNSDATGERPEEYVLSQFAITRTLLFAFPIAFIAAFIFADGTLGLLVLLAGVIMLAARRRSLPDVMVGSRLGRWWTWTLAGTVMIGSSLIVIAIRGEEGGELSRFFLFELPFLAGVLLVAASAIRALALMMERLSRPTV